MSPPGARFPEWFDVPLNYRKYLKVLAYTLFLFVVQTVWVVPLPYRGLRVDLLLPVMFAVGYGSTPLKATGYALVWGFVLDVFSGRFWGLHVGSYMITVWLVALTHTRVELAHAAYQMLFVGACGLLQSLLLGVFIWVQSAPVAPGVGFWESLGVRTLLIMLLAPLIGAPVMRFSEKGE